MAAARGPKRPDVARASSVPFYIGKAQYQYWKHTQLIIDVIEGQGGTFSLEGSTGKAFHTRSRLFDAAELAEVEAEDLAQGR